MTKKEFKFVLKDTTFVDNNKINYEEIIDIIKLCNTLLANNKNDRGLYATARALEKENFNIDKRIDMLRSQFTK